MSELNVTTQVATPPVKIRKNARYRYMEEEGGETSDGNLKQTYIEYYSNYSIAHNMEFEYDPDLGSITLQFDFNKKKLYDLLDILDNDETIDRFEVDVYGENVDPNVEFDLDGVVNKQPEEIIVNIFPKPEESLFDVDVIDNSINYDDSNLYDDSDRLQEVVRTIRINSKGKRIIKYKCQKGYRWNGKTCQLISGAELNRKRIAIKKAVKTKKAKGSSYNKRITKARMRARRFRKLQGFK